MRPAGTMGSMSEPDGENPDQVMIVGPDGRPVGTVRVPAETGDDGAAGTADPAPRDAEDLSGAVQEPATVMRIGTMVKQLLEEMRATELDDASRRRLRQIHETSLTELGAALSPALREELSRVIEPFAADGTPSDGELRIAQAQLVGWLEGLFHGIQTALVAQQMAARVQLEGMRKGLPGGGSAAAEGADGGATGQYL